ncbi:AraC family transcriptional regulator [Azospirillum melinis]
MTQLPHPAVPSWAGDVSEWTEGPDLVVQWGGDSETDEFRLGTREYDWHSHRRGQLSCIESGLAHVRTVHGSWLLPPHRAGWLPPGERHRVAVSGALSGWTVLIAPEAARALPDRPCVVGVGELMRALVRRAAGWELREQLTPEQSRLTAVLFDEIRRAPQEALHLPMPTDRRLLRIVNALLEDPGDRRTLEEWAKMAGLSPRTARRLFLGETGFTFAQWRQQAQLTQALERLARREAVADIADALGYATPSAFIAMFKRCFGVSPARCFADREPFP